MRARLLAAGALLAACGTTTRELFTVTTADGVRIHGLWLPAASPRPFTPAVLFCQGQSGDLQDHYGQLKLSATSATTSSPSTIAGTG